jgi:hypothetical protein
MESPVDPLQIGPMKHSMPLAGIVVLAGLNLRAARDSRQADVMVYVEGGRFPASLVDYGARRSVTWMYARIGVRIEWRTGSAASGAAPGSLATIQVRYAGDHEEHLPLDSLAFAEPFGDGTTTITVMYKRVQFVAGRSGREQSILAHVLAHEIGHVLQRTDRHVGTGVMKAHWTGQDFDAMERKPLEFTRDDIDLIVWGLTARKAQTAAADHGNDILRPPGSSRK